MKASAVPFGVLFGILALCGCGSDGGGGGQGGTGSGGGTETGEDPSGDGSASAGGTVGGGSTSAGEGPGNGATAGDASSGGTSGGVEGQTLSERYPGDVGMADDPAVLFFDDFEQGWGAWDWPDADTEHLFLTTDAATANGGSRFLRSTVTGDQLLQDQYISSSTKATFPERTDTMYFRFYARFVGIAPNPHHWVRIAAGNDTYDSSGLANTVPPGDQGFWFDFDISNDDVFNFYVYWYLMRSGWCNDGSTTPGCDGQQGGDPYFYGNVFRPPAQTPFVRDTWVCIEMMGQANTVGSSDGALAFWVDDQLADRYEPGHPIGTWLRETFHTGGCEFSACTEPQPFEGFDFRSSAEVGFKSIFLDAYYERGSFENKRAALEAQGLTVSDVQTIEYDDVVVANERIGCKVPLE